VNIKIPKAILNDPALLIPELDPVDKGKYFILSCPSCDKRETFLYKGQDLIVCSRRNKCGYSKNLVDYIKETHGLEDKEAFDFIMHSFSDEGETQTYKEIIQEQSILKLPEGLEFFDENKSSYVQDIVIKYLYSRNIPRKNIRQLGYVYEPGSEYHQTILIPFYEEGEIVYFICRDYTDKKIKRYTNPKGFDSKKFVYNIDKIWSGGNVFIFEGLFDALSLDDQVGTAMLSADLGRVQAVKIFSKIPKNIIFVPDNDTTGFNKLSRNIDLLLLYKPPSLDINIFIYWLDESIKDFNESKCNYIPIENCVEWKRNRAILRRS
tara:strand:+ start:2232 stop:3194 length:963 start_codon:yes stop_codon:yes gene_type:complete